MMKYFRMLVFQPTNHVVWLTQESIPSQYIARRVPNVSKELDYRVFQMSEIPMQKAEFKKYRLIKSKDIDNFELGELPSEFCEKVAVLRAQCYVMESITDAVSRLKEKLDVVNNPIANTDIDIDKLSLVFQKQLGITDQDSKKLIKFKRDEIAHNLEQLNLAEINAELILSKTTTVDEVTVYLELVKSELMMTQVVLLENVL